MKINVNNMKKLAPMCSGLVKYFCRSAARLHGLLAFREQLNIAHATGRYQTFAEVEADMEEIKRSIAKSAILCGSLLAKLNVLGRKYDVGAICSDLEDSNITDVIDAINAYVDELVRLSDFKAWIEETTNNLA